jgi:hypothetical protein
MQICGAGLCIQACAFGILAGAPPFPVFCLGYFVSGFGNALYVSLPVLATLSTGRED